MTEGTAWAALAAWLAVVLVHALWRSGGEAAPDPIRASGPLDQL